MKENIPKSDFILVVATSRYWQKDVHSDKISNGISEMLQVESRTAYALNKPIVVFAKEGTDVGGFLPSVTQYLTLNCDKAEFNIEVHLIRAMLSLTFNIINKQNEQRSSTQMAKQ